MSQIEVLAKTKEEAIEKAAAESGIEAANLEVADEFEPDEQDLKEFAEKNGLAEPPSPDEITLYVVRADAGHYVKKAEEWTQGLIERFAPGSKATAVQFRNLIIIRLDVPETSILIGKKGATLDSLQHVVVRALLTIDENFPDVMLDVEGYRERKLARLEKEARQAAQKALRSGRKIPLAPMTPAERKFVHNMLKDMTDIRTESRGTDRARHIVVEPIGVAPTQSERGERRGGGGGRPGGGNRGSHGGGNRGERGNERGGDRRGNGGGGQKVSHGRGPAGTLPRDSRPSEITEEQRQLLYGRLAAQREAEEELNDHAIEEKKESLLPHYNPEESAPDTDDDRKDGHLADEIIE